VYTLRNSTDNIINRVQGWIKRREGYSPGARIERGHNASIRFLFPIINMASNKLKIIIINFTSYGLNDLLPAHNYIGRRLSRRSIRKVSHIKGNKSLDHNPVRVRPNNYRQWRYIQVWRLP
jgi:hypothetical protein